MLWCLMSWLCVFKYIFGWKTQSTSRMESDWNVLRTRPFTPINTLISPTSFPSIKIPSFSLPSYGFHAYISVINTVYTTTNTTNISIMLFKTPKALYMGRGIIHGSNYVLEQTTHQVCMCEPGSSEEPGQSYASLVLMSRALSMPTTSSDLMSLINGLWPSTMSHVC